MESGPGVVVLEKVNQARFEFKEKIKIKEGWGVAGEGRHVASYQMVDTVTVCLSVCVCALVVSDREEKKREQSKKGYTWHCL